MDGVLCDFKKAAEKVTGMPITKWSYASKEEKWAPIKNTPRFWHTLPWMPGGQQLWNFIKKHNPHILSAYVEESHDPNCIPGKSHWARTNLGIGINRINLVKRVQKQNYAKVVGEPAILIDDYKKNTDQFTQRGGIGILHTTTSNTINQLKKLGF
jgi:dTDP-D-glucose 4,6-dehydratase